MCLAMGEIERYTCAKKVTSDYYGFLFPAPTICAAVLPKYIPSSSAISLPPCSVMVSYFLQHFILFWTVTFTHPFALSLAHFTVHICGETEIYFAVCISLPYQAFLSLRKKNIDITFIFVCSFQSVSFCGLSCLDSQNRGFPLFFP